MNYRSTPYEEWERVVGIMDNVRKALTIQWDLIDANPDADADRSRTATMLQTADELHQMIQYARAGLDTNAGEALRLWISVAAVSFDQIGELLHGMPDPDMSIGHSSLPQQED